jgi:Na+-driven multidrug efflux pump
LLELFVRGAEPAVVQAGVEYLGVALLVQPFAAVAIAFTGAINGAAKTVPPLLLDASVYALVLAPVAIGYAAREGASLLGLWWCLAAANGVLAVLYVVYLEAVRWTVVGRAGPAGVGGPSQTTG